MNRCLGPYMDEAIALLLDGANIAQIDRVCVGLVVGLILSSYPPPPLSRP